MTESRNSRHHMIADGVVRGPWVGLRALAAARRSLRARTIVGVATLVIGASGTEVVEVDHASFSLWTPTPLVKKHFFGIMVRCYNMKVLS